MPLVGRRDIPIKRDQVREWLQAYRRQKKMDLEAFIYSRVEAAGHAGVRVDMGEPYGEMTLTEIILEEADSYV